MDEIKVGEYGRTNLGNIIKFAWLVREGIIDNKKVVLVDKMKETTNYYYYFKKNEIIVKHSKRITDLLKVGDYVNGYKITLINEPSIANCYKRILYAEDENGYLIKSFSEDDIKSIVTKEQFESMEYKVGD
jgi:hypothetical protein